MELFSIWMVTWKCRTGKYITQDMKYRIVEVLRIAIIRSGLFAPIWLRTRTWRTQSPRTRVSFCPRSLPPEPREEQVTDVRNRKSVLMKTSAERSKCQCYLGCVTVNFCIFCFQPNKIFHWRTINYRNKDSWFAALAIRKTHRFKWAFVKKIKWWPKQILKCATFTAVGSSINRYLLYTDNC